MASSLQPAGDRGGEEAQQEAADEGESGDEAVVVEGQLEDVVQVLRQQEGGVSVGPEDSHVGHHHGQDGPAGQETPHRDVLQAGPELGGRRLGRQQVALWLGGEGGGGGRVGDQEEPGDQPHQGGETAQTVECQSPVLLPQFSTTEVQVRPELVLASALLCHKEPARTSKDPMNCLPLSWFFMAQGRP